eukprot:7385445-Prymnesium_polylepis.1
MNSSFCCLYANSSTGRSCASSFVLSAATSCDAGDWYGTARLTTSLTSCSSMRAAAAREGTAVGEL